MKQENFVSTTEAAEITGLDRVQIFRLIKSGQLPAVRIGRNYIIRKKDLGVFTDEVTSKDKKVIESSVRRVFSDYGDVIRELGDK